MNDSPGITTLDPEAVRTKDGCLLCGSIAGHSGWCANAPSATTFSLNWMADAICGGMELFFGGTAETKEALDTCGKCPVRRACAEYALEARMDHGVWGGLTSQDRREIRTGWATLEEALA